MGELADALNEEGQTALEAHRHGECEDHCPYCVERERARKNVHHFVDLYVDGGVFGRNPSPRGVYWSVCLPNDEVIRKQDRTMKYKTNNDAEWLAVLEALRWAVAELGKEKLVKGIQIHSDSRHVVDCFNEKKHIKVERHVRLYFECKRLVERLPFVVVKWVPREVSVEKVGH